MRVAGKAQNSGQNTGDFRKNAVKLGAEWGNGRKKRFQIAQKCSARLDEKANKMYYLQVILYLSAGGGAAFVSGSKRRNLYGHDS